MSIKITPREQEVLDLMRQGLDNREIAKRMKVSYTVVKHHITKMTLRAGI